MSARIVILFIFLFGKAAYSQSLEQANLLMMQENYTEAKLLLNDIIKADSTNVKALYKLGLCCLAGNDYISAINALEYCLLRSDPDITVQLALGRAFIGSGNYSGAEEIYADVLKKDSLNESALMNLADICMDLQDYNRAKVLYINLSRLDTSNSYYQKQAGWCLYKLDKLDDAADYYERSLCFNKYDVSSALDLALIYFRMDKLDSAFNKIRTFNEQYTSDARISKMLGDIEMKRKNYAEAVSYYKQTLNNSDTSAVVFQKLGISIYLNAAGNPGSDSSESLEIYREGLDNLKRSFKKNNQDFLTGLYMGLTYKQIGNYSMAVQMLETTLRLMIPSYVSEVYNDLASSYEHNREYRKALDAYNNAIEHNPESKINYYLIAYLYDTRLSDKRTAAKYYRKYLEWPQGDKLLKDFARKRVAALSK